MTRKHIKLKQDLKSGYSVSGVQTTKQWIVDLDFSPVWGLRLRNSSTTEVKSLLIV